MEKSWLFSLFNCFDMINCEKRNYTGENSWNYYWYCQTVPFAWILNVQTSVFVRSSLEIKSSETDLSLRSIFLCYRIFLIYNVTLIKVSGYKKIYLDQIYSHMIDIYMSSPIYIGIQIGQKEKKKKIKLLDNYPKLNYFLCCTC